MKSSPAPELSGQRHLNRQLLQTLTTNAGKLQYVLSGMYFRFFGGTVDESFRTHLGDYLLGNFLPSRLRSFA